MVNRRMVTPSREISVGYMAHRSDGEGLALIFDEIGLEKLTFFGE